MEKARAANILVNTNLKKFTGCSNWAVMIKKIPVGTLAKAVHAVLYKFEIIKSIKMQLVRLWQKTVIEFEQVDQANLAVTKWSILIGKDTVHITRTNMDKKS
ncbi:hypothetical protein G9A89_012129 [Geosiphon pyriformis]|nr:hypothetical protein G9A89_012129 [Geosiphon pyriformis]